MPRETTRTIRLECQLSQDELINYSRKMVEARQERIRAEATLKAVSSQIKAEIAEHEAQEGKYIMQIQTGKEWREVECAVEFDFNAGHKLIVRKDTGAIIKTERITDAERQEELALNPPEKLDEEEMGDEDCD